MDDLRHAGVGWPNGAVKNDAVFTLPSPDLLMLATEGRYHHDVAVRAGKRCLWRAVPRVGKRPAELGWSPAKFVTEALNLTDEPTLPITDFVFANELDLNSERGDGADDYAGLENRYRLIGGWGYSVVNGLRAALPGARIHWPAWTPDHFAFGDFAPLWTPAAEACDVVDFHAYDSLNAVEQQYLTLRRLFPNKPLALTEWHCKGDVQAERYVLEWLAETMAADPLFDAAYFFIWRWWNHPGWWSDDWDIEHSPDRLRLFRDPPVVAQPEPAPVPEPVPEPVMSRDEVIAISNRVADEVGIPRLLLLATGIAESNLTNARRPANPADDQRYWLPPDPFDISAGVWQQTVRFDPDYHGGDDWPGQDEIERILALQMDVERSARVAAGNLRAKLQQAMAA